jgi:Yip1 domain
VNERDETEWQWFGHAVRDSVVRPRQFARSLSGEHFGLAGVLIALLAGIAFSISADAVFVASKGLDPAQYVGQITTSAFVEGLRVTIIVAVLATAMALIARLMRGSASLDQTFTAVAFSMTSLFLMPFVAALLVLVPRSLGVVAVLSLVLAARFLYGLVENLRALVSLAVAGLGAALIVASVPLVLADVVSRMEFVALGYAPNLAPALTAPPIAGPTSTFQGEGYEITLPARWKRVDLGLPDQIGRFETDTDVLVVMRIRGSAFLAPDGFADVALLPWRRGLTENGNWLSGGGPSRTIERTGDVLLVDDVFRGSVDGTPELLRQFAAAVGTQGLALQFRFIRPVDERSALDESSAIAATWRVIGR